MIRREVTLTVARWLGEPVLDVTVAMVPHAASRPRTAIRAGRATIYMPVDHRRAEAHIRAFVAAAWRGRVTLDEPVVVVTHAWLPRRKSDRGDGELDASTATQDVDNLAKLAMDACNGIVWIDDRRVVGLWSSKSRHAVDGQPGVRIVVWRAT